MIFDVCMGFNHHYRSWPFGLTCCTKILQENDNIIIYKLSHTCRWAMAIILTISVKRKIKPTRTWDHLCYIMKNYRKLRFQKMKYNCTSGRLLMDDVLLDDSFEEQAQNETVHYHYTEFIYPAKISNSLSNIPITTRKDIAPVWQSNMHSRMYGRGKKKNSANIYYSSNQMITDTGFNTFLKVLMTTCCPHWLTPKASGHWTALRQTYTLFCYKNICNKNIDHEISEILRIRQECSTWGWDLFCNIPKCWKSVNTINLSIKVKK